MKKTIRAVKKDKSQKRNITFGGSITVKEYKLLNDLSKKLGVSKTETIVRGLKMLGKEQGVEVQE